MASPRGEPPVVSTPSDREILITCVFDAPRELVWEAWTRPEHVVRWWGFRDHKMTTCEVDLRPGGSWRYVLRAPDGTEDAWHGVYREVVPPERLVQTEVYEGVPDAEAVNTMILTSEGERTRIRITVLHQSKANRDAHLGAGMEMGLRVTMERLAEILQVLKS